jgi:papain like protease
LAHEIIRRWLANDPSNKVELLHPEEFKALAATVMSAAASNRRSVHGRPTQNEFMELLPRITALADKVPDWPELGYFAAWIADKGRDSVTALAYYRRVLAKLDTARQANLIARVNDRIDSLDQVSRPPAQDRSQVQIKPALDYSSNIKVIRDSGAEGSVVGHALATALEFQIAKATHEEHKVSARHIYYLARQATGSTESDSGAIIKDAIRALAKKGAVEEKVWPYVPGEYAAKPPPAVNTARKFRISDARKVNSLDDLKRALTQNGPIVAGITMYASAMSPKTAETGLIPLPTPKAQIIGGHAIVVVGFDDKQERIKFVNSWGPSWGDHGFGYLPYEYIRKYMSDAWTFKLAKT